MTAPESIRIVGWPATPVPLPTYLRRRYRLAGGEGAAVLVADEVEGPAAPSGTTCLRIGDVPLDDDGAILAFANEAGTVGTDAVEEMPIAEFALTAIAIRDAVASWRLLRGVPAGDLVWSLPRFRDLGEGDAGSAAADFLNVVLETGLGSVAPAVRVGPPPQAEDVPLHALCCLELFNHIAAGSDFAVCANETCDRLFVLDEPARKRGVMYCSRSCAKAQAQREFRRRRKSEQTSA